MKKFEVNVPDGFGYYWITKKSGEEKVMIYLTPGKYFKEQHVVEAWECPGIGRYRLNYQALPHWQWEKVVKP